MRQGKKMAIYEVELPIENARKQKEQESISWSELAELTHATQVERFNWCSCEDNEGQENPYADCSKVVD
jgi:hypothetical protein